MKETAHIGKIINSFFHYQQKENFTICFLLHRLLGITWQHLDVFWLCHAAVFFALPPMPKTDSQGKTW